MDRHRFDTDPDPESNFYFDGDPDPDCHQDGAELCGSYPKFTDVGRGVKSGHDFKYFGLCIEIFVELSKKYICLELIPIRIRQNDAEPAQSGTTTLTNIAKNKLISRQSPRKVEQSGISWHHFKICLQLRC